MGYEEDVVDRECGGGIGCFLGIGFGGAGARPG